MIAIPKNINMHFHLRRFCSAICTLTLIMMTACSSADKDNANDKSKKATQVTLAQVQSKGLALTEETVGSLESIIDPTVSAEISARVLQVLVNPGQKIKKGQVVALLDATDFNLQGQEAQSEIGRIEALIRNQQKMVERNRALVDKNFISKNALDDATTQLDALQQQLVGARGRVASISHNGAKHRVISPADGVVETQVVAKGDFVKVGDPIIKIINNRLLRAHLPFPESVASKLKPGLALELSTPTSNSLVHTVIRDIKPQINEQSRAVDVTADIEGHLDWQPGGSVNAKVILGQRDGALLVPEQSVVLRPAGEVVYTVPAHQGEQKAQQRIIKTGLAEQGFVEVLSGLQAGEWVVVDGAGFLTDKADVIIAK